MTVEKAVILAAGKGTRMGALTREIPKPMLPVCGKPMIEHILERLAKAGVRQALIVVGHLGEKIREHLINPPLPVQFREQVERNGTARAALLARQFAAGEPFLLTFGDILCEPEDYRGLMRRLQGETRGVLGVIHSPDPYQGAAVYEDQGRVVRIIEKPPRGASTTNWNSAGVYVFSPLLFDFLETVPLSPRGEYELTSAISSMIDAGHQIVMHVLERPWLDVGRPEDLERAQSLMSAHEKPAPGRLC